MPSLTQTRDAAVALLKTAMPHVQRVEAFAGELDLAALSQKGLGQGGSIFVAALNAVNVGQALDFDMQAHFGCFAVARAPKPEQREAQALELAETAASVIHGATFGLVGLSPAKVINLSAVPDESIEQSGVVVWAMLWQQNITFGE